MGTHQTRRVYGMYRSIKTVDHHVSAVLAKLDVSSREEAAELARQHPDL